MQHVILFMVYKVITKIEKIKLLIFTSSEYVEFSDLVEAMF